MNCIRVDLYSGSTSFQSLLKDTNLPPVPLGGISLTLDRSLERVFGPGATQLAIGFEGMSCQGVGHDISDSSSLDGTVPLYATSTPDRKIGSKKRSRSMDSSFGNISGISMTGGLRGEFSSGDEDAGDVDEGSKKPRLGGGIDSGQESSDTDSNMETENDSEGEEGSQLGSVCETSQTTPGVHPEPSPVEPLVPEVDPEQQGQQESC